ncbi:putative protein-like, partial [Capsicum annuum]
MVDVEPCLNEELNSNLWKLTEISESSQCRSLKLPENLGVTKISRLIYTNSGDAILALTSNAIHLLWKWRRNEQNSSGKATASVSPQLWQPSSGILMTNDVREPIHEEAVSCFSLSKNDCYVLSASGADSQLCVWSTDGWEKQRARSLHLLGRSTSQSDTRVQFHHNQTHFLVVHEAQIAIYETTELECLKQWVPCESAAPISHATFSCDSQLIYASFLDATVCVFAARNLYRRCRIIPSAYLSPSI